MSTNPIWFDCFDEKGKYVGVELTYEIPGILEEAGLAVELFDRPLALRLFWTAELMRRGRGDLTVTTDATGRLLPRRR